MTGCFFSSCGLIQRVDHLSADVRHTKLVVHFLNTRGPTITQFLLTFLHHLLHMQQVLQIPLVLPIRVVLRLRGEISEHRHNRVGQVFGLTLRLHHEIGILRYPVNKDLGTVSLVDSILQHDVVVILLKPLRIRQPHPRESQSNGFHNY